MHQTDMINTDVTDEDISRILGAKASADSNTNTKEKTTQNTISEALH